METKIPYHIGVTVVDGKVYRRCRQCREVKELNETNFLKRTHVHSSEYGGWRGRCRLCYNKLARNKQEISHADRAITKRYRLKQAKTKPFLLLFNTAKGNSRRQKREFTIIKADVSNLWNKQKGLCYYTGRPMKFELCCNDSCSLDRIDSSKGYVKDNIVLCQRQVNIMKNDASVDELIQFCKDILKTIT